MKRNAVMTEIAYAEPAANICPQEIRLFDIRQLSSHPFCQLFLNLFENTLEKTLSLDVFNRAYYQLRRIGSREHFFENCLKILDISYQVTDTDLEKIPKTGPLVVVANHPFGGTEGVILGNLMESIRPDVKILGNFLLQPIPEISDRIIPVNPFDTPRSPAANMKGLREAVKWVKSGGAIIVFPAGEVSHLKFHQIGIRDSEWSSHIAAMIRHSQADVLPVFFPGRNSLLFQIMGLLHPMFRTAMLPRELVNKRNRKIQVSIGSPVSWNKLRQFGTDKAVIGYLRAMTYFLGNRNTRKKIFFQKMNFFTRSVQNVIPAIPSHRLNAEIEALPEDQTVYKFKDMSVHIAYASQIPNVLAEICRLRELTFRQVGEGTGKSTDTDRFDAYYLHLFLWNKTRQEIAGAYRLGLSDEIIPRFGTKGLYTSTLFHLRAGFVQEMADAIELGRSFIRPEYQKKHNSLVLLWQGIGRFAAANPRYKILFGSVSISRDYRKISKNLMVEFLNQHKLNPELSGLVRAKNPYRIWGNIGFDKEILRSPNSDIDDISVLISEIEKDGKKVPVLLRHYLKLNAELIGFNVDKNFSDVVDGLIRVDLTRTDPKLLKRFMGDRGFWEFAEYHQIPTGPGS